MTAPPPDLASAREQFLALVDEVRPDLHRYSSRLVGSVIDGEDVVQDTLAKAFYALSQSPELPALRPWLFAIARNTAIDLLRRYDRKHGESLDEEPIETSLPVDVSATRVALAAFLSLPITQRSAVIMKDVLGESLEDIATHLETTIEAVKALLVRGRAKLKAHRDTPPTTPPSPELRELMNQYAALFNRRDWVGVQALLIEECRLDLVSKSQRKGKSVGMYFGRYAQEPEVELRVGTCEGRACLGVFRGGATPVSIILLEAHAGRVAMIRDFRYVPYLTSELVFTPS